MLLWHSLFLLDIKNTCEVQHNSKERLFGWNPWNVNSDLLRSPSLLLVPQLCALPSCTCSTPHQNPPELKDKVRWELRWRLLLKQTGPYYAFPPPFLLYCICETWFQSHRVALNLLCNQGWLIPAASFLIAGIAGVSHCDQFIQDMGTNSELGVCWAASLPTKLHPHAPKGLV